jgi:hypothetical protein
VSADAAARITADVADLLPARNGSTTPDPPEPAAGFFIDWGEFWNRDRRDADWIYDQVLARGRGHAIFAGHKVGKSLLTLYIVAVLVQRPDVVVIYLDYEMGEDDLYDRLEDMGYGPGSDFTRLKYALLPSLPPLDTQIGADLLLARVDTVANQHPGADIVVIIDTTGRAVAGEENSADTYRAFYRWTGLGLKQRGNTWARLDHAGKDNAKGQRGSSAKGDDVDIVWKLAKTENGLELRVDARRMSWVPDKVTFRQINDPHLRFEEVAADWPAGTKEVADLLDQLDVPLNVGDRPAGTALRAAGHTSKQTVIRAAQKWRRHKAETGLR